MLSRLLKNRAVASRTVEGGFDASDPVSRIVASLNLPESTRAASYAVVERMLVRIVENSDCGPRDAERLLLPRLSLDTEFICTHPLTAETFPIAAGLLAIRVKIRSSATSEADRAMLEGLLSAYEQMFDKELQAIATAAPHKQP